MNSKTILALSFALNLALTGTAYYVFKKPEAQVVPEETAAVADKGKKRTQKTNDAVEEVVIAHEILATNEPATGNEFTWRQLEARDFKVYIEKLRGVQCPEETIRDIITAEVNKLYAKRLRTAR